MCEIHTPIEMRGNRHAEKQVLISYLLFARRVPAAAVDVVYIADAKGGLPSGNRLNVYDGFFWTGSDFDDRSRGTIAVRCV